MPPLFWPTAPILSGIPSDDPQVLANRVVDDLLSRKFMYYGSAGIHYAEVCAAIGALRLVEKTHDTDLLEQIIARYEIMLEDGNNLISFRPHVDQFVTGIVPLQIYMINGDRR